MKSKTALLLMLVDVYGFFVNFYENVINLHNRFRDHLKSNIFFNIYSSFGILTKSRKWVNCFDYEGLDTFSLLCLYLYGNIFSSMKDHLNVLSWYHDELENSKYYVSTLYNNGKKEEIFVFADDNTPTYHTILPISKNVGYALLFDSDYLNQSSYIDITRAFLLFDKSLSKFTISSQDFADILYYKGYVNKIINKPNIIIMNLCTMEEHIFKADDIITI